MTYVEFIIFLPSLFSFRMYSCLAFVNSIWDYKPVYYQTLMLAYCPMDSVCSVFPPHYPVPTKFTLTEINDYVLIARTMEFSKWRRLDFFFPTVSLQTLLNIFCSWGHTGVDGPTDAFFFLPFPQFSNLSLCWGNIPLGALLDTSYDRNVSPPGWLDQELCLAMCDLPRFLCLIQVGNFPPRPEYFPQMRVMITTSLEY